MKVELSARGMEILVQLLTSETVRVKTLSASLIASLAHTRAGIPDGLIIAGKLFRCSLLSSYHSSTPQHATLIAQRYFPEGTINKRNFQVESRNPEKENNVFTYS